MTTRNDIERVLWKACDSFRGKIDSSRYKDYILSMLFVKYLSDVSNERREGYIKQYDRDMRRVERAMSRERFAMDEQSTFDYLYANRNDAEIGQKINVALNHIEEHNSGKLRNVFRAIDFNSQVDFGEPKEKNATLRNLLEDFNGLDLRPSQLGSADIIGDAYEYMIAMFASDAGKKGGEFFTPSQVSELVASLVQPKENDRIYDPTCGSGGLLLKAYKKVLSGKVAIYGQELNAQTWALCTMNMFLHGVEFDKFDIACEDTLTNPQHWDDEPFELICTNPPYSIKWAGDDNPLLINDPRFSPAGVLAPKSKAAIVCFPGIMYRGGAEKKIRQYLIDNGYVDCVIQLPDNLFFGTTIATNILILRRGKSDSTTLFIDASKECVKVTNSNKLTQDNIEHIVQLFTERKDVPHVAHLAAYEEIVEQDYNLSVSTYVEAEDIREKVDIVKLNAEIKDIVAREQMLRDEIDKIIAEIEG